MPSFRILSIDGGGIRGFVPARVLAHLEDLAGQSIHRLFDLIAGTSTGGMLALALTRPHPAQGGKPLSAAELAHLYRTRGHEVFTAAPGRQLGTLGGLFGPMYGTAGLEGLLRDILGNAHLDHALTRVLVPAYDIERRRPALFKSWKPENQRLLMRDVARATSAAPTYFPPARLENPKALLIDGGIYANNPALCALAEAQRLAPGASVQLLSLGTGAYPPPLASARAASGWGKVGWVRPLLEYMFDGMTDTVDYQARQFVGARYLRLQPQLENADQTMDNTTPGHLRALELLAESLLETAEPQLRAFARTLAHPDETPQTPDCASLPCDTEMVPRPVG
jgi:predicted acylesterase/phospholipase RssA